MDGSLPVVDAKACTACGVDKSIGDFYTNYGKPRWQCKACSKLKVKQWVEKNPEAYRATQRRLFKKYMQQPDFVEKKRAAAREHGRKKRLDERVREYGRRWYRESRDRDPVKFLVRAAKSRAKMKSLPFDLTVEWAREKWTGNCEVTGLAFAVQKGCQGPWSPSIDKVDPKLGYIQSNCRFVLSAINCMKGNGTYEDVLTIAKAIVERA
jgi:hypothetical protein